VLIAQDFLGDDDFVMYLGDNFIIGGITELVEEFRAGQLRRADPAHQGGQPVAVRRRRARAARRRHDAGGEAEGAQERPGPGRRLHVPAGIHDAVRAIKPSARGELEITDALQWLIDEGRDVRPHLVTGYWKDTGRLEDMLECNRKVLESLEPACTAASTPSRC
jgi:glucose-1-phosphate thymidylyltransferase